jgi:hypothetical protein
MSASLFVVVPLVLLLVGLACSFVGWGLGVGWGGCDFSGHATAHQTYTGDTILPTAGLVSYWTLGEEPGATTAIDLKSGHDGTYVTAPAYPDIPETQSAASSGNFQLGGGGIVAGDIRDPFASPDDRTTCMVADGGYVSVPFNPDINPSGPFTIEAWVRADWSAGDLLRFRCVINAMDVSGGNKGFAIFSNPNNVWEAWVGDGTATDAAWTIVRSGNPIRLGMVYYLVATYDGSTLNLWIDGDPVSNGLPGGYVANATNSLYIGAGAPWLPLRPQAPGVQDGPLWPFKGAIQDVAIYNRALTSEEIMTHVTDGNGFHVSP